MLSVKEEIFKFLDNNFEVTYNDQEYVTIFKINWIHKKTKVERNFVGITFDSIDYLEDKIHNISEKFNRINFELIILDWTEQKFGFIPKEIEVLKLFHKS